MVISGDIDAYIMVYKFHNKTRSHVAQPPMGRYITRACLAVLYIILIHMYLFVSISYLISDGEIHN